MTNKQNNAEAKFSSHEWGKASTAIVFGFDHPNYKIISGKRKNKHSY